MLHKELEIVTASMPPHDAINSQYEGRGLCRLNPLTTACKRWLMANSMTVKEQNSRADIVSTLVPGLVTNFAAMSELATPLANATEIRAQSDCLSDGGTITAGEACANVRPDKTTRTKDKFRMAAT